MVKTRESKRFVVAWENNCSGWNYQSFATLKEAQRYQRTLNAESGIYDLSCRDLRFELRDSARVVVVSARARKRRREQTNGTRRRRNKTVAPAMDESRKETRHRRAAGNE